MYFENFTVIVKEVIGHTGFLNSPPNPGLSLSTNNRGGSKGRPFRSKKMRALSPAGCARRHLGSPALSPQSDFTAHSWELGSSLPAQTGKQEAVTILPRGGADKFPFLGGHLSRPSTLLDAGEALAAGP